MSACTSGKKGNPRKESPNLIPLAAVLLYFFSGVRPIMLEVWLPSFFGESEIILYSVHRLLEEPASVVNAP